MTRAPRHGSWAAALLATCATGCIWGTRDSYHCDEDTDCTLGEAGRCEQDHRCTQYDASCPTLRRYSDHAEALSGVCLDDRVEPANPCAAGQPPALPTGCFADVCEALPACCESGWSEACVLEAQVRCAALACETHLALTATRGANTELFELTYTAAGWSGAASRPERQTFLSWLAPRPGTAEPRLASLTGDARGLLIGDHVFDLDQRPYQHLASVDFDRDGRDTIALSWGDATTPFTIRLWNLDGGTYRDLSVPATQRIVWADWDHDAFPDAFAFAGGNYHVIANVGDPLAPRMLVGTSFSSMPGGTNQTPGTALVHGLELADVDRDHQLDLVATGTQVRVHLAQPRIRDAPSLSIDCSPPIAPGTACDPATAAFASAAAPDTAGTALFVGLYPQRTLYRGVVTGTQVTFTALAAPCPGTCPGFIGMVARDLDGDHHPDLVAIDADLGFVTALSSQGYAATYARPIAPVLAGFNAVRTSVTGVMP